MLRTRRPRDETPRERNAELGARGQSGRHTGHDLYLDVVPLEKVDFLGSASEEHRVAAFQTHDDVVPRRVGEALVDEVLRSRMAAERFPTAIFSARHASASVSGWIKASWNTMSASPSSRAARRVRRSGAPGPAPTR